MHIIKDQKQQIQNLVKTEETSTKGLQDLQIQGIGNGKANKGKVQMWSTPMSLSSTQATTPNLASILEQRRKVREMDLEISPEVAATVVKQYLLPMFQVDNRQISNKKRKELQGKENDHLNEFEKEMEPAKGTVLAELKLSDKLMIELRTAKQELRETKQKLKDQEQSAIGMQEKVYLAQHQKMQSEVDIQLINYQGNLNFYEQSSQTFDNLIDQLDSINQKYNESETRRTNFANLLSNEKSITDKLNNKAIELEHGNAILRMENDIMGERLRNLYKSINEILNRKFIEEKLSNEIQLLTISLRNLLKFQNELIQKFSQIAYEKDKIQEDLSQMTKYRNELIAEHNKFMIRSKEKIQKLESSMENMKEENMNLTLEVTDLNKRNADLSQQYEQLRTKMKQYKSRFNKYAVSEEKICKNCNKYYVEKENFNWSCNTHHSQWNEDNKIFFCCGETNQGAIGCRIQKHESKDDEDEEDLKEKEDLDKKKSLNVKCYLCNEIGHKTNECNRDPNIRTCFEIKEELKRIEAIKNKNKNKNKNQLEIFELRQKLLEQMEQKFEQTGFGHAQVSSLYLTESENDDFEISLNENNIQNFPSNQLFNKFGSSETIKIQQEKFSEPYKHKKGFEDILLVKPDPAPQNNFIKVEVLITKEYIEAQTKNKKNNVQTITSVNELCKFVSGVSNAFQLINESLQDNTKLSDQSPIEILQSVNNIKLKKKNQEDLSSARTNDDNIIFTKSIFQSEAMIKDDQISQENTKEVEAMESLKLKQDQEDLITCASPKIVRKSYK